MTEYLYSAQQTGDFEVKNSRMKILGTAVISAIAIGSIGFVGGCNSRQEILKDRPMVPPPSNQEPSNPILAAPAPAVVAPAVVQPVLPPAPAPVLVPAAAKPAPVVETVPK